GFNTAWGKQRSRAAHPPQKRNTATSQGKLQGRLVRLPCQDLQDAGWPPGLVTPTEGRRAPGSGARNPSRFQSIKRSETPTCERPLGLELVPDNSPSRST